MFTKGEWERHNAPNGEHIWCGNKHIADLDGENANANARLIAQAPKLVDAIKSVLSSLDNMELDATLEGCQMVLQQAIAPVEEK